MKTGYIKHKMFSAISSTSIAVSSGLLAYGVYQSQYGQKSLQEMQQQQQKLFLEELNRVQYVNINTPYGTPPKSSIATKFSPQLDLELSRSRSSSFDGQEELKSYAGRSAQRNVRGAK